MKQLSEMDGTYFEEYGNYSDSKFIEKINKNSIDKKYMSKQFNTTYEAIEENIKFGEQWKYEIDMTFLALKNIEESVYTENIENLKKKITEIEELKKIREETIRIRKNLEIDLYQDNSSNQWAAAYFTEACEMRKLAIVLKEYYYTITGEVPFYTDEKCYD